MNLISARTHRQAGRAAAFTDFLGQHQAIAHSTFVDLGPTRVPWQEDGGISSSVLDVVATSSPSVLLHAARLSTMADIKAEEDKKVDHFPIHVKIRMQHARWPSVGFVSIAKRLSKGLSVKPDSLLAECGGDRIRAADLARAQLAHSLDADAGTSVRQQPN
eukprot:2230813-Karenia_brevis.AAC.1